MSQTTAKVRPLTLCSNSSGRQNACIAYHVRARRLWNFCHPPPQGATAPSGPGPPHCRGFTITHTHTHKTLDRTPLDKWSARRRDLYLTSHKTHGRQASMPQRDSNPQSQQASGRKPTTRPPGSVWNCFEASENLIMSFFPRYIFYRTSQLSSVSFWKSHPLSVCYEKLKYGFVMLRNWI